MVGEMSGDTQGERALTPEQLRLQTASDLARTMASDHLAHEQNAPYSEALRRALSSPLPEVTPPQQEGEQ